MPRCHVATPARVYKDVLQYDLALRLRETGKEGCDLKNDIYSLEHLAEVLTQVVAGGPLDGSAGAGDVGLHSRRLVPSCELLRLRFRS